MAAARIIGSKWGLPKRFWKRHHSCEIAPGSIPPDTELDCVLGPTWWRTHPVRDYTYRFNSWGFRGEDFEKYQGQKVNVCIGDSMTMNLGGPIESSWPALLGQHFNNPTLNFGLHGLSYYLYASMYEKINSYFQVENLYLLWNVFDINESEKQGKIIYSSMGASDRIKILKNFCWIKGAFWQFDPPWTFDPFELHCLLEHFPNAHDYLRPCQIDCTSLDIELLLNSDFIKEKYQELSGNSWPKYEQFCLQLVMKSNAADLFSNPIDKRLIQELINDHISKLVLRNRDGWHMGHYANQLLADYFLRQTKATV